MNKRLTLSFFLACSAFALVANSAFAGFGITPPYVKNDSLTKNSHYEQQIILVRSDPVDDLKATVTVAVPGANDWITIDPGKEFVLPRGAVQVPMVAKVDVPDNAKFGNYTGNIRVVISSAQGPQSGTVGIALGAQIDVDLNIVDRKIISFAVRSVRVSDLNAGHQWWWFYFPGKIKFGMTVRNTGNTLAAPDHVQFDITDITSGKILESIDSTNDIEKIKPFEQKEVIAELPTRLPPGGYSVNYKIYTTATEVLQQGQLSLSILPYGTIPGDTGYGFWGLTTKEKLIIVFGILGILGILAFIEELIRRKFRKASQ